MLNKLPQKKEIHCQKILQLFENESNFGNLFLGSLDSLEAETIKSFNIFVILSIMDEWLYKHKHILERIEELNIRESKWIDVEDEEDVEIEQHFEECFEFINRCLQNSNVLVHCQAGVSRSATIVIAYVMKKLKLSRDLAIKFVASKRSIICPNEGFLMCLANYEIKLLGNLPDRKGSFDLSDSEFESEKFINSFINHIISENDKDMEKGNLFLGQFTTLKPFYIDKYKIKSIVSIIDENYYNKMKVKNLIENMNITEHLWINLKNEPTPNLEIFFDQSYNFINENLNKGNVLVHCQKGVSRGSAIVIAFLIKKFQVGYYEALKFVKEKRDCVLPNEGFELKLIEYSEKALSEKENSLKL